MGAEMDYCLSPKTFKLPSSADTCFSDRLVSMNKGEMFLGHKRCQLYDTAQTVISEGLPTEGRDLLE